MIAFQKERKDSIKMNLNDSCRELSLQVDNEDDSEEELFAQK